MLPINEHLSAVVSSFNSVPSFASQRRDALQEHLQALSTVFVQHAAHRDFGLTLLHRHCDLPLDSVMVHSVAPSDAESDVCRIEGAASRAVYPTSFLARTREEFCPFEYSSQGPCASSTLTVGFLRELADYLWTHDLQRVFGLSRVSPSGRPRVERLLSAGDGTTAACVAHEIDHRDGVITEWGFLCADGMVQVRSLKACKEHPSGGHLRSEDADA